MRAAVDPVRDIGAALQTIEKPARYLGGESGMTVKEQANLRVMLCFPDLYEIGMSNNAMRILYGGLNGRAGVACERVFAPAPDFAALLKERGLPLYGLESGTPVRDADILAFTVGYELAATNILAVLEATGIPLVAKDRAESDPVVIAGGPAITNPAPFSRFLDAVWIGEAEGRFFDLAEEMAAARKAGAARHELIAMLSAEPAVWTPDKKAVRAIYEDFATTEYGLSFPVPVLKPVQDHGVVEVMRGCPNGCRFCHAGYFYRPQRLRGPELIARDVEAQIVKGGHREITLSSLSSGDYPGIFRLLSVLNARWSSRGISFQLPSLKVESFPLELIEGISGTRKSGLTFAVETPLDEWQRSVNKVVPRDKIVAILKEAEGRGYRLAKFYFMIGLPLPDVGQAEETAIIDYLTALADATTIKLNVTLATFVPKPHTPFQWSRQLDPLEAARRIYAIKDAFRKDARVKVSYHAPYLSWLEGIIARGDEGVGELILSAYRHGACFDAWDDKFKKDAWEAALGDTKFDTAARTGPRDMEALLPWDAVMLRVSKAYLKKEAQRSKKPELTSICIHNCTNPCGSCTDNMEIPENSIHSEVNEGLRRLEEESAARFQDSAQVPAAESKRVRVMFRFHKTGRAAYYPHHTVWDVLASSFERAGYCVEFSQGFNPSPRMEISEPLPLGCSSVEEYGLVLLDGGRDGVPDAEALPGRLNRFLPHGLNVDAAYVLYWPSGTKFPSLSKSHWGSLFSLDVSQAGLDEDMLVRNLSGLMGADHRLAGAKVTIASPGVVHVLLPFAGTRQLGIQSLFAGATGKDFKHTALRLCRLAQYARGDGGQPVPYPAAYNA